MHFFKWLVYVGVLKVTQVFDIFEKFSNVHRKFSNLLRVQRLQNVLTLKNFFKICTYGVLFLILSVGIH
jgi:hypothetical protein